jgi:hypothetical protein
MTRLSSAWRALTPDQRLAGGASAALFVTMFLPWYQQNAVRQRPARGAAAESQPERVPGLLVRRGRRPARRPGRALPAVRAGRAALLPAPGRRWLGRDSPLGSGWLCCSCCACSTSPESRPMASPRTSASNGGSSSRLRPPATRGRRLALMRAGARTEAPLVRRPRRARLSTRGDRRGPAACATGALLRARRPIPERSRGAHPRVSDAARRRHAPRRSPPRDPRRPVAADRRDRAAVLRGPRLRPRAG